MSATTTKDEDLIILDSDNSDIFDFGDVETKKSSPSSIEEPSEPELIIDFGISDSKENKEIIEKTDDMKLNDSFSFDFDMGNTDEIEPSKELSEKNESSQETKIEDSSIDLFSDEIVSENINEEKVSENINEEKVSDVVQDKTNNSFLDAVSNDIGDISSILDQTIQKLNSRKEVISTQKSNKSNQVNDLKGQIKKLQEQVEGLNEEIETLDIEAKKIDKNVFSIEKMKSDDSSENGDRERKHNLNNIKKTK